MRHMRTDDEGHGLPAVVLDERPRAVVGAVLHLVHVHALQLLPGLVVLTPAAAAAAHFWLSVSQLPLLAAAAALSLSVSCSPVFPGRCVFSFWYQQK